MDRQPFSNLTNLQLEHRPKPHPSKPPPDRKENLPAAITQDSNRITRMGTGPCGFQRRIRELIITCPCTQGIFSYHPDSGAFEDACEFCEHASSMHEDINVVGDALHSGEARAGKLKETETRERDIVKHAPSEESSYYNTPWEQSKYYHPAITPRENTITSLFSQLQDVRVIYVRGTPASGKSTLCNLLHHHVKSTRSDIEVHRIQFRAEIPLPWEDYLSKTNRLILLDEAQATYSDQELWSSLIKPVAEGRYGPMIALFGCYGSPSAGPTSFPITPMQFAPDQRMSLRPLSGIESNPSIFFTRPEFQDCISRIVTQSFHSGQPFLPCEDFVEQLWVMTNGHPGVTRELMRFLMDATEFRTYRKDQTTIPAEALLDFCRDKDRLYQRLRTSGAGRGFPRKTIVLSNTKLAAFFREVLVSDSYTEKQDTNPLLDMCNKNGWLQAETYPGPDDTIAYVFPSRLHRGYLETLLRLESPPFPIHRFPKLQGFCIETIKSFSRESLVCNDKTLGTGALQRPLEAQYQDEMYRASYEVLGRQIYLSSEWSPAGLNGRVDFQVTSMKWSIECLREGDRLQEHVARFEEGGRYFNWITNGYIIEYILIDFRTSEPPKLNYPAPFLIFAVFDEHFYSCAIYNSTGDQLDEFAIPA